MAKRKHDDGSGAANGLPTCADCGSIDLIQDIGDKYCGACGTVVNELVIFANPEDDPYCMNSMNYVPHKRYNRRTTDKNHAPFHTRWSRMQTTTAHRHIEMLADQLNLFGLAERAQRIFNDYIKKRVRNGVSRPFGSALAECSSACIYIAAHEQNRQLKLIDLAQVVRCSVFVIGRIAKAMLRVLGIHMPPLDPLLRAEAAVNRLFGYLQKIKDDDDFYSDVITLLPGRAKSSQGFPQQLLSFMLGSEFMRARLLTITGLTMEFFRACALSMGANPSVLVCSAIALGVEYMFAAAESTPDLKLSRRHREVIYKLVVLPNGISHHTITKHSTDTHKSLVEASKTVPWLKESTVTTSVAILHLEDILMCYQHLQEWLFSLQLQSQDDGEDVVIDHAAKVRLSSVVSNLSKPPAYARAEKRRKRRLEIIKNCEAAAADSGSEGIEEQDTSSESRWERALVQRLLAVGADRNALVSLPLHSLEKLLPAVARSRNPVTVDLDAPSVGPQDMPDTELYEYVYVSSSE
ncbi:hypothetical protein LPJ63_001331 [Coemansia sp. RSA 2711]|nr:hypothetical protein LPJ63_001331 [Coemansia sp. RSA 2711]